MQLHDIINALDFKISGGSEYCWKCFGPDARFMEFESEYADATIIFDSKNQTVYEATVSAKEDSDDNLPRPYRWINPEYKDELLKECKARNIDNSYAWDDVKWIDLEVSEDFTTKANALFFNKPFDKRIVVPLDIEDDVLMQLALEAHKRDITLNKMVEHLLQNVIDQRLLSTNTMP